MSDEIINNSRINNKRKRVIDDEPTVIEITDEASLKKFQRTENPFAVSPFNKKKWFSATSVKNYFCKDTLLDWLEEYGKNKEIAGKHSSATTIEENTEKSSFTAFIMDKGNRFEKTIMNILYKRFPNDIIDIGCDRNNLGYNKYLETIEAMNKGIPIIYSAMLYNFDDNTHGIPDLIVRSDFINKLVSVKMLTTGEANVVAPKLEKPSALKRTGYHYVIVDIKFKTLRLRADGIHLLNEGLISAYKAQLSVYNKAISSIQGYDPQYAFLLGRAWSYTKYNIKHKGINPFDRLGKINYKTIDLHIPLQLTKALNWLSDMRENGEGWNPLKPHREELYPNMSNQYDGHWRPIKEKIADQIKEITSLWMCGTKHRENALEKNITKWTDPRCNSKTLGIGGKKVSKTVDIMLDVNRSEGGDLLYPQYIKNNYCDWRTKRRTLEFFVDFESINDAITCELKNDSLTTGFSIIFMIGVGYEEPNTKEWIYESFIVDDLSIEAEGKICEDFNKYIELTIDLYQAENNTKLERTDVAFFHWGNHEIVSFKEALERHCPFGFDKWYTRDTLWIDFLKVFREEPIIPKGCMSFGLKDVAKKMHSHNMIATTWDIEGNCKDGLSATMSCYYTAKECKEKGIKLSEHKNMKDIETYNEVDVKVIYEIMKYLRENHSQIDMIEEENTEEESDKMEE